MRLPEVIITTGARDTEADGFRIARSLELDGDVIVLPAGSVVTTSIGDNEPLTVTLTFFASDVRYRHVDDPS